MLHNIEDNIDLACKVKKKLVLRERGLIVLR
jgi:hypothetical protein